ncbi:MAG: zf-HC2 domain-containing protein [Myxococcaceae bacterium]
MNCEESRATLERQFQGDEVSAEATAQLDAHLATCAECRSYRDQLSRLDVALEQGALGPGRQDALEQKLMARLGVASAQTPAAQVIPLAPRRRSFAPLVGGVVALAAAVALVVFWPRAGDDGFTPRAGEGSAFGVRAFCVNGGKVVAEARSAPGASLVCAEGVIQLTVTTPTAGALSVSLDGDEALSPPVQGLALDAGVDQPLSFSTPVGEWLSRPRTVRARFDDGKSVTVVELVVSRSSQ